MSLSLQAIQKHLEQQGIPSTYKDNARLIHSSTTLAPYIVLGISDLGRMSPERSTDVLLIIDHCGLVTSNQQQIRVIDHSPRLTTTRVPIGDCELLANKLNKIHHIPTSDPQLLQKITHIFNEAMWACLGATDPLTKSNCDNGNENYSGEIEKLRLADRELDMRWEDYKNPL